MTNALPRSDSDPFEQDMAGAGDWQQLRGELTSLLTDETDGPEAPGAAAGDTRRHQQALREVNRAVARFSDRDEATPGGPDSNLVRAAIAEIRQRQGVPAGATVRRMQPQTPFAALSTAISAANERLGEIEVQLNEQRGAAGSIKTIAGQIGEITHVVEMLANAVGDTGQAGRLEQRIGELAELIEREDKPDFDQFTSRIEDLANTVQMLSEAHGQHSALIERFGQAQTAQTKTLEALSGGADREAFVHITRRLEEVSASVERVADLQIQQVQQLARQTKDSPHQQEAAAAGLRSIEASVRSVYDRIDEIEGRLARPDPRLDALSEAMGSFTAAMAERPQPSDALLPLIESIGDKLEGLGSADSALAALRQEFEGLKASVTSALEPRLASIETQVGSLADKIAARAPDPAIAKMEAQVRQLVARMDQTGEQLSGLARLYADGDGGEQRPVNLDALAEMVAERTSSAIERAMARPAAAELSEASLSELEARFTRLLQHSPVTAPEAAANAGGDDEIAARLQRIESSLSRRLTGRHDDADKQDGAGDAPAARDDAPAATPEAPVTPVAAVVPGPGLRDAMPVSPEADAPLRDKPFGDPVPQPQLDADFGDFAPDSFHFDNPEAERPPRPVSSLDRQAVPGEGAPPPSRNAFIEAHRAAQRAAAARNGAAAATGANSVIGRALARFQSGDELRDTAPVAPEPVPAAPTERKLSRKERKALKAAEQALASSAPRANDPIANPGPADTDPETIDVAPEAEIREDDAREGFLSRHRRPILLGASVVAIAALTANLVYQRIGHHTPGITAGAGTQAAPAKSGPLAAPKADDPVADKTSSLPAKPPVVPRTDALATGSIGADAAAPHAALMESQALPVPPAAQAATVDLAAMPAAGQPIVATTTPQGASGSAAAGVIGAPDDTATAASQAGVPAETMRADAVASTGAATISAPDTPPADTASPVKVEMPPAGIGPDSLRRAAANGDARAQFEVAAIYTEGRAVPQDLKAAEVWYERAAAQGFAPAQYRLASLYETGKGVAKDLEQAKLWYERAAEAGNRMSMHNLASLYAGGQLGKQDFGLAAKWFEKAADLGMTDSQFNLGMLYARGLGVPQNLETSYKWFAIAAESGDKDAGKARDDIAKSLDAESVGKVKAEIGDWKPSPIDLAANFAPIGTWTKDFDPGDAITDKKVVAKVQEALDRLGFDVGSPDGLMGPKTSDAIRAFEKATGMSEVGKVNPRLLAVLGSQPV